MPLKTGKATQDEAREIMARELAGGSSYKTARKRVIGEFERKYGKDNYPHPNTMRAAENQVRNERAKAGRQKATLTLRDNRARADERRQQQQRQATGQQAREVYAFERGPQADRNVRDSRFEFDYVDPRSGETRRVIVIAPIVGRADANAIVWQLVATIEQKKDPYERQLWFNMFGSIKAGLEQAGYLK